MLFRAAGLVGASEEAHIYLTIILKRRRGPMQNVLAPGLEEFVDGPGFSSSINSALYAKHGMKLSTARQPFLGHNILCSSENFSLKHVYFVVKDGKKYLRRYIFL